MSSHGTDFDALLTRGALAALVLAALWALGVVVAVAVEARTGGRVQLAERAGCPARVRLWLLGAFLALFAAAAPANASDAGAGPGPEQGTLTSLDVALDGLPLPDRAAAPRGPRGHKVVVEPGDSLWRIARALLPADAPDATVAAAVADLYAVNRRDLGPDPDLLRPGQHLLVGDLDTHSEAP